jgi:MYXO-CTERM domain-containing protein
MSRSASLGLASVLAAPLLAIACTGSLAHADFVYGLNGSGSKGIYRIDTNTGATTLVAATPSLTVGGSGGNGLAYDAANNAFYYVRQTGTTRFFMRNVGGTETTLGAITAPGVVFSGTFYNGHYWAVRNGTANTALRLTPAGAGFTQSILPIGLPVNANFGDIASTATGLTYAACTMGFFSFNLSTPGSPATTVTLAPSNYQIAFGNTGLFGVQGSNIYSVNTTTGIRTFTAATAPGLSFNDLASIPTPGTLALLGLAGLGARRRRR